MFIIVYQPKDTLRIETQYIGPFADYVEAMEHFVTLPAAIDCEMKWIEEVKKPEA